MKTSLAPRAIHDRINSGELKAVRFNKRVFRIREDELARWINTASV